MRVRIPREPRQPPWDPAHPGSCGGRQRAPGRLRTRRRIHPRCSHTSPGRPHSGTHRCLGPHREWAELGCGHHQDAHSHWDARSHWDMPFPLTGAADAVGCLGHGEANGTHAGDLLAATVVTGQVTAVLSAGSRWFWNMDTASMACPCHPRSTRFPSHSMDPPRDGDSARERWQGAMVTSTCWDLWHGKGRGLGTLPMDSWPSPSLEIHGVEREGHPA